MGEHQRGTQHQGVKQRAGGVGILFLCLACCCVLVSCSPQTRYAVLSTIFDGVPPYMTPEERARFEAEQDARSAKEEARAQKLARARGRNKFRKARSFLHGPFATDECSRCHNLKGTVGFRKGSLGDEDGVDSKNDLAEGARLNISVTDLCVRCHSDFREESIEDEGLWVHGPVASGWCVLCHVPHATRFPPLLTGSPSAKICTGCHVRADLVAFTAEHRPESPDDGYPPLPKEDVRKKGARKTAQAKEAPAEAKPEPEVVQVVKDCVRCHDPHKGRNHLILRDDYLARAEDKPSEASVRDGGQRP